MATRKIRITGAGIYGQPTDENPSGEYPVGYEFETEAAMPPGWAGRAIVVGEEPAEGSAFVVNEDDESEAGKARNAAIREANGQIERLKAEHTAATAMLQDRAERAEADLQQAREQIEALTEKLNASELGHSSPVDGAATADEIKSAVDMLDGSVDAHWTAAGLPAVDAVSELTGKTVTRAQITEVAPDAKRPA